MVPTSACLSIGWNTSEARQKQNAWWTQPGKKIWHWRICKTNTTVIQAKQQRGEKKQQRRQQEQKRHKGAIRAAIQNRHKKLTPPRPDNPPQLSEQLAPSMPIKLLTATPHMVDAKPRREAANKANAQKPGKLLQCDNGPKALAQTNHKKPNGDKTKKHPPVKKSNKKEVQNIDATRPL